MTCNEFLEDLRRIGQKIPVKFPFKGGEDDPMVVHVESCQTCSKFLEVFVPDPPQYGNAQSAEDFLLAWILRERRD